MNQTYTISVTWGRSCTYHPFSTPKIQWDGFLDVQGGKVTYLDKLTYNFVAWSQAHEVAARIFDANIPGSLRTVGTFLSWKSDVTPGDPGSLEGIRFQLDGDENTKVTLDMLPAKLQFKLADLLRKGYLRFHVGDKYAGNVVSIFLGKDARPRVLREHYLQSLQQSGTSGYLVMPDDFTDAQKRYYHSMYGASLRPGDTISAKFPFANFDIAKQTPCLLKIQASGILGYMDIAAEERIDFMVQIGNFQKEISWVYTNRACMPKLEDLYVSVPRDILKPMDNCIKLTYLDGTSPLLIHRIFVDTEYASLASRLAQLPSLPKERRFHVGYETDMITPANGDVDAFLDALYQEEIGDYIQFRERSASAADEDIIRWSKKVKQYNFIASASNTTRREAIDTFRENLGEYFLGENEHEISNLAYGWGDADPMEIRKDRTLPECKASYLKRMQAKIVSQAIPQHHLDYEAGVETVISEIPGSHCTLMLSNARGASRCYNRDFWGVHIANHVQKIPLDEDTVRRLFTVVAESWLFGASMVNDEEVALRYNHDTTYAYSDAIPTAYREIYQSLYHYCNNISLGKPVVNTGFLHGNYDFLVGGTMAGPYIPRPKFWGEFGPESEGWDTDTPEAGWKLIDSYLPGAHLNPIPQEPEDIRIFYSGTPYGQIDLLPVTAGVENLSRYELLYLPGWNTMTPELYEDLIAYVRNGGHLVMCAAQCSEHITRKFLSEKKDFAFIHDGDLSKLAGVKVTAPEGTVNTVIFEDGEVYTDPGVPGLQTELVGGKAIAVDQCGNPVLVENVIGKGKVWMLTIGEYWGHDNLDTLRRAICQRAAAEHPCTVTISGSDEIEYHLFDCGDYRRVVLLNTDWTCAGNVKHVTLHTVNMYLPVAVTEGQMKHVLFTDDFVLSFDVPGGIADNLVVTENSASFDLQGVDQTSVRFFTRRAVAGISADGADIISNGNTITADFGACWNRCKVTICFA